MAAASEESNDAAEYHWANSAEAEWITINGAASGRVGTFSTQISRRGAVTPPSTAMFTLTVTFDQPVTITSEIAQGYTLVGDSRTGTTFTFTKPATEWTFQLTFNFVGETAGSILGTATMNVSPAGDTTWAPPATDSGTLTD